MDKQSVRRVYVEKKEQFATRAHELKKDLSDNLGISGLEDIRIFNRYDVSGVTDDEFTKAVELVLSEPQTDEVHLENLELPQGYKEFGVESLPGQYDQRADSASQCIQIITCGSRPTCVTATIIAIKGNIASEDILKIQEYVINPVESRKASLKKPDTLEQETQVPDDVKVVKGFIDMDDDTLERYKSDMGLAMSKEDIKCIRQYFLSEKRNPTITEIRVLDTYWSDHCRHTTFNTRIDNVKIDDGSVYSQTVKYAYKRYLDTRYEVYGDRIKTKPVCLMDLATCAMKALKKRGMLEDLDESEEINACSIKVPVDTGDGIEDYLVMFKNETHNHPTEIEPFGGAATCLGGAIRDPLSGRSYVYQAMRVTGSADPTVPLSDTLPGKLSQYKITTGAARGYSSYGNQIGLATGLVDEIYHPGYMAKRMEIGAVIGAAPAKQVKRQRPVPGDPVILLGGRTGRDGCGGATGSSKEHDEGSITSCGAEVQKGNPPTERKIQRLFRDPEVCALIKKCNDFGAGGVCVAIGELADGIDIDLDSVLKKYEGLDGTELAISESQERMAVVVSPDNEELFIKAAQKENLEAVTVAYVTGTRRMRMKWRGKHIVDISRDFIDTNGAEQFTDINIRLPKAGYEPVNKITDDRTFETVLKTVLSDLNSCSKRGLAEMFDSTIGAGTVNMPFAGEKQLTPETGMTALIPSNSSVTKTATAMTYSFDPYLSSWSPFHGAYYAVMESVMKIAAMGADPIKSRLTFQEYFEKLGQDPEIWGKPLAALLGAFSAQMDLGVPAIGGKDSMSGTFMDLKVPPTLVSFAVTAMDPDRVISAAFRKIEGTVVCLRPIKQNNGLPDIDSVKENINTIRSLHDGDLILSASVPGGAGIGQATVKMCFGNNSGIVFNEELEINELFEPAHGSVILQLDACDISELKADIADGRMIVLGKTIENPTVIYKDEKILLDDLIKVWEKPLKKVFPTKSDVLSWDEEVQIGKRKLNIYTCGQKTPSPRVFIPVFPGTNCEYDTAHAFKEAGAVPEVIVFRNNTPQEVTDSIERFKNAIQRSNILMIPGGFSAGDEPDGSGKFIAAVFRNPYLREEIEKLLSKRDGLILGICNGFQALVKIGLLPFGEITDVDSNSPILTFNSIGRHVSRYVRTRIESNRSPWLSGVDEGDIHLVPVSHGEGRFFAPQEVLKLLFTNDQVAARYVDQEGQPAMQEPFNPNGSAFGIEAITSPDGRILGKMGHSERKGEFVGRNIPGNKDQRIFESGVAYFK